MIQNKQANESLIEGNLGETCEKSDGVHMNISECAIAVLNCNLNWNDDVHI